MQLKGALISLGQPHQTGQHPSLGVPVSNHGVEVRESGSVDPHARRRPWPRVQHMNASLGFFIGV